MTHVFLAPARASWGESTLGLRIADDLRQHGDRVVFVIHKALTRLFAGTPYEVVVLGDQQGVDLDDFLTDVVTTERPRSVVLCDLLMALEALERRGASPRTLSRFDLPIVGVDVWHLPEIGDRIDVRIDHDLRVAPSVAAHPFRLVPVPFVRPSATNAVQLLPTVPDSLGIRAELSLPGGPMVLLCTSSWQHRRTGIPHVDAALDAVPRLVAVYLERLDVDVCHVGPTAFDWRLGGRYHFRAQLPAASFSRLVASADVVLSLNQCATSNTLAISAGVPVVSLVHGGIGLDALGYAPSAELQSWSSHLPLYPFRMWPMSGRRTLGLVLGGNPYAPLLNSVELVDERAVHAVLRQALAGGDARPREAYLEVVRRLPTPHDLLCTWIR